MKERRVHRKRQKRLSRRWIPISQNRSKNGKQNVYAFCFLGPSLAGVALFVLAPFLDVIKRSFYNAAGREFVKLVNYKTVLENGAFRDAFLNTGKFLLVCLPLLLISSFAIALALFGMKKWRGIFQSSFLIPMAIPVASVVVFWKLLFDHHGTLNHVMERLGAEGVDWMNTGYAFWILVFSYLWRNMGYDIVLWTAGLSGIPTELYEAARVNGAGKSQCFWYITLPQMKPTIYMTGILSFVNAFRVFREAYLIAGDYPHKSIYMLQHLFNNWFTKLDIQKMSAAAVILAAGISLLLVIIQTINERQERDR